MKRRVYICHTFYHVYVACLKELHLRHLSGEGTAASGGEAGADLILSLMSNRFGDLKRRAERSGLFGKVLLFDEKKDDFFPELAPLKRDTGSLVRNMLNRIRFCRRLGRLEEPYVPTDFSRYEDVYVFCDSDPIGYYLNYKKIRYHALEDGLNCLRNFDAARYDNRGHFALKAALARTGLIFIQNGWSRYCIDMEVNDISQIALPCPKYIEQPREELVSELTEADKALLLDLFVENMDDLRERLAEGADSPRVLVLSEPLCAPDTRRRIFRDIVDTYGSVGGRKAVVMIKQHPRDLVDYAPDFPDAVLLSGSFPMEMLGFIPGLFFDRLVSVYTVVDALHFVGEKIVLGHDFMDRYEDPDVHRKNEKI